MWSLQFHTSYVCCHLWVAPCCQVLVCKPMLPYVWFAYGASATCIAPSCSNYGFCVQVQYHAMLHLSNTSQIKSVSLWPCLDTTQCAVTCVCARVRCTWPSSLKHIGSQRQMCQALAQQCHTVLGTCHEWFHLELQEHQEQQHREGWRRSGQ